MPDNWSYVVAAWAIAAAALAGYWRYLARRERALEGAGRPAPRRAGEAPSRPPAAGAAPGGPAARP